MPRSSSAAKQRKRIAPTAVADGFNGRNKQTAGFLFLSSSSSSRRRGVSLSNDKRKTSNSVPKRKPTLHFDDDDDSSTSSGSSIEVQLLSSSQQKRKQLRMAAAAAAPSPAATTSSTSSSDDFALNIPPKRRAKTKVPSSNNNRCKNRSKNNRSSHTNPKTILTDPKMDAASAVSNEENDKEDIIDIDDSTSDDENNQNGNQKTESISAKVDNPPKRTPPQVQQPVFMDDANVDNDDDLDLEVTPTTRALSCLCWKCHVTLKIPPQASSSSSPSKKPSTSQEPQSSMFCYYAMHVHPTLQVPICSVCNEEVSSYYESQLQSQQQKQQQPGDDDNDYCYACATDATLVVCDFCPRAFCTTCVAQAFGGGQKGKNIVQSLLQEDDAWNCILCLPPVALQGLQDELKVPQQDETKDDGDNKNNNNNNEKRPVEEVLRELDLVEQEQRRCQQQWDDVEVMTAKRREIETELRGLSPSEMKVLVDDEIQALKELAIRHDRRLGDMASSLQEELEVVHNVDLAKVYEDIFGYGIRNKNNNDDRNNNNNDDTDETSDWKKAADDEIDQRHNLEKTRPVEPTLSPACYNKEIYDDVEDLGTKDEDERDCPGDGFRSASVRPTKEQIEEARRIEDQTLAEKKVEICFSYDNDMDVTETLEEEQQTSCQGSGGVSRVRRDAFVTAKAQMQVRSLPKASPPVPMEEEEEEAETDQTSTAAVVVPQRQQLQKEKLLAAATASPSKGIVDLTSDTPFKKIKRHSLSSPGLKRAPLALEDDSARSWSPSMKKKGDSLDDEYYQPTDPEFAKSDFVLCSPETFRSTSERRVKTVAVSYKLATHLKPHQREGIAHMWKNCFVDLNVRTKKGEELHEAKDVGGCLLAHSMGLGKSLQTIALLHTLFYNPSLGDNRRKRLINTALLSVPVNTIASWKHEFNKWTDKSMVIYDTTQITNGGREHIVDQWLSRGGVLIVSSSSIARIATSCPRLLSPGPDVLILDEAHLSLANSITQSYKTLAAIQTKRRILLTGTPFQNNVKEYYQMVQFMRPGVLDMSWAVFEREFANPIMKGMPSDAAPAEIRECHLKSAQLKAILNAFVHRKDTSVLRAVLPPLQQVVLHLRQTRLQTKLYTAQKRFVKRNNITNFLKDYQLCRPIYNHPACLLMQHPSAHASDSDEDIGAPMADHLWWKSTADKVGEKAMKAVSSSNKFVMFFHILLHSVSIGDKVLVFSQCLRTLDFLEQVLALPRWSDHVSSLKEAFPGNTLGGWSKGAQYLRIDGQIDSGSRGDLITEFNKVESSVQLFLISSKAGGIGITLTAANRVVLIDTHFNPTVMTQALARCYRYGQEKPVYVYRFLTEGTGEEKIYSRSVNKQGVSMRVIDGKNFSGSFTEKELANLTINDTWVQCENCEKWRMLLNSGEEEDELPDKWYCHMNVKDPQNNNCDASEKDNRWYHNYFDLERIDTGKGEHEDQDAALPSPSIGSGADALSEKVNLAASDPNKETNVKKDVILTKLLDESSATGATVSKFYFHEALLEEVEVESDPLSNGPESEDAMNTGESDAKPAAIPRPDNTAVDHNSSAPKASTIDEVGPSRVAAVLVPRPGNTSNSKATTSSSTAGQKRTIGAVGSSAETKVKKEKQQAKLEGPSPPEQKDGDTESARNTKRRRVDRKRASLPLVKMERQDNPETSRGNRKPSPLASIKNGSQRPAQPKKKLAGTTKREKQVVIDLSSDSD